MFSKASKPSTGADAASGSGDGKQGGGKQGGGVPSIISPDLKVEGNLNSRGDIQIDGTVEGDVTSRGLTVGEKAVVHGALVAETIRVYGTVKGTITANSVILASTAKVDGDITHRTLSMEGGASMAGQIKRLERPIGGDTSTPAASGYSGQTQSKPYSA